MKTVQCYLLIILTIMLSFMNACTGIAKRQSIPTTFYRDHIFNGEYEKIWSATEKALSNYPIEQSNMDSGVIVTEWVKGDNVWMSPHLNKKPSSGMREKISVFLTKGKVQSSGGAVKVQVKKDLEVHKDFLLEPEKLPSDGLEETMILYRIERELEIERDLTSYNNQKVESIQKEKRKKNQIKNSKNKKFRKTKN